MKNGGLALAALLVISGVLRVAGPSAAPPQSSEVTARHLETAALGPKGSYPNAVAAEIQGFYGISPNSPSNVSELTAHWNVPARARSRAQFVIAILPDPVHTHLGLFFDRSIDAMLQAAQKKGYAFDRSILPWDRKPSLESTNLKERQEQVEEQKQRETFPGLIFFSRWASSGP